MKSIKQSNDRISALPSDIRRHILSFLTTREAMQTSTLSKTWRYEWLNIPYLNFGRKFLLKRRDSINSESNDFLESVTIVPNHEVVQRFMEFLNSTFISKRKTFQKLRLYIPPIQELSPTYLDGFIVDELEVEVIGYSTETTRNDLYCVPKFVLSFNSLTKLYIQGCKLFEDISVNEINLPVLSELSISYVTMSQEMVDILIASCTRVQKLSFTYCSGYGSLQLLQHPNLKHLIHKSNGGFELLEIDSENLCSLLHENSGARCKLVLSASCCRTLTNIELVGCNVDDELGFCIYPSLSDLKLSKCRFTSYWLNQHLSQLLCISVLKIVYNSGLEHYLQITSDRPQSLKLNKTELEFSCANLYDFTFCSQWNLKSLCSETRILPSSIIIKLNMKYPSSTWDVRIIRMLKQLRHCKYLCIETATIESVIIGRLRRQRYESPLCEIDELKVACANSMSCFDITRCIEAMLWLCPRLKTLCIKEFFSPRFSSNAHPQKKLSNFLLKLIYKEPTNELPQTTCGCYTSQPINCWRHSIRDFEIVEEQGFIGFEEDEGWVKRFLDKAVMGI